MATLDRYCLALLASSDFGAAAMVSWKRSAALA